MKSRSSPDRSLPPPHVYANITRDRYGIVSRGRFVEVEERRDGGLSLTAVRDDAVEILASDDFSTFRLPSFAGLPAGEIEQRLMRGVEDLGSTLSFGDHPAEFRVRHLAAARFVANEENLPHFDLFEALLISRSGGTVLVSARDSLAADLALLEELSAPAPAEPCDPSRLPVVWRNGTGGVLLHEAVGHPSQHDVELPAPPPLQIRDVPVYGSLLKLGVDDSGRPAVESSFHAPLPLRSLRREGFRNPALPRMTNLVVDPSADSFAPPEVRVEVLHVSGGDYDPLFDRVRLQISRANLVSENRVTSLAPFVIRAGRPALLRSIRGTRGDRVRFPGVVCSDQGQRIVCGTWCPDLLTAPFHD